MLPKAEINMAGSWKHRRVDLLLTFQSNAIDAVADNPDLQFTKLPSPIRVIGQFGIGVSIDARKR